MMLMIARTLVAAAIVVLAMPAFAQTAPRARLRAEITVSSDLVHLGDLLENAGPAATEAVFRAPDLGATGTVQASRIVAAAREKGVTEVDTAGLAEVSVTRASRTVSLEEIKRA